MNDFKQARIPDLDLTKYGVTKSWNDGFNKQRLKSFNERKQAEADVLKDGTPGVAGPDPREFTLNQERVDKVRQRVANSLMWNRVQYAEFGAGRYENKNHRKFRVYHLWFPENHIDCYSYRDGNPPADVDRPEHLKGLNLVIDLDTVPTDTWEFFKRFEAARQRALTLKKATRPVERKVWLPNS